jgi:hypothetical protein
MTPILTRGPAASLKGVEAGMFFEQIPVGHARDVIAHGPMQAFALDPLRRGGNRGQGGQ